MQQITVASDVTRALGELPEQVLLYIVGGRRSAFFTAA